MVFDKRKSPQYPTIPIILTVPSAHPCLSGTCKLAIIFPQLWRFRTLCNTVDGWLKATVDFCAKVRQARYDEAIFMPKVIKAIQDSPFFWVQAQRLTFTHWGVVAAEWSYVT